MEVEPPRNAETTEFTEFKGGPGGEDVRHGAWSWMECSTWNVRVVRHEPASTVVTRGC